MQTIKNEPVGFAGQELEKYIVRMTGAKPGIELCVEEDAFRGAFGASFDPALDDAWDAAFSGGKARVKASNPRSVLLGTYRLLHALGCRFLSPAEGGEIVPQKRMEELSAHVSESAENRYRIICIEGAVSGENAVNMLDWGAKNGFNGYFIQFDDGREFYRRWYCHADNPFKETQEVPESILSACVEATDAEIKRRGFLYHNKGHGWTGAAIGSMTVGWESVAQDDIPEENRQFLAMIDGKRALFHGVPTNTNLCYSNPAVRARIAALVAEYAAKKPYVDAIHVWMADLYNNHCECEECMKAKVSDWYVLLLNDIDARLSAAGLDTKIVFLAYFELLEAPAKERLNNPSRFIFMFAPAARNYYGSWADAWGKEKRENEDYFEFPRNRFRCVTSNESHLVYLKKWQNVFDGDSFVFDYYLCADMFRDFGTMRLAKTIFDDIKTYGKMGVHGLTSCQSQRAFFPCGFPMYVMGRALLGGADYEALEGEYFSAAYGKQWEKIAAVLKRVSALTPHSYIRFETDDVNPQAAGELGALLAALPALREEVAACAGETPFQRMNIEKLLVHFEVLQAFLPLLQRRAEGEAREVLLAEYEKTVCPLIFRREDEFQAEWDAESENGIFTIMMRDAWKALPEHFADAKKM